MGCHFLHQGIFPTQGLNLYLFVSCIEQADSLPAPSPAVLLVSQEFVDALVWALAFHWFWLGHTLLFTQLLMNYVARANWLSFWNSVKGQEPPFRLIDLTFRSPFSTGHGSYRNCWCLLGLHLTPQGLSDLVLKLKVFAQGRWATRNEELYSVASLSAHFPDLDLFLSKWRTELQRLCICLV